MRGIEQGVGFPITAIDQFSGAFDKLKGRVTGMQGDFARLNGAIAAFTGGLGIGAFAAFMKQTLDAHEEMNKFSQKLGIAVGELSALKYAANQSDVSMEALGKGVKALSEKMVAAVDPTSKAGRLLKALGVESSDATGPAIEKLATAFAKLPDGATKAALATELFGKAGMEMIPFLNQGQEGIRLLKEEALRLGIVMDERATAAAERFNDNLKTIKASSERLGHALVNELSDPLLRISNAMKEAAIEGGILKAVWVGMGGVLAEIFGMNADPVAKRIREINSEIADLQEKIAAGPRDLGGGVQDRAFINQYIERVKELRGELRAAQALQDALAGKFDDQASRRARQGRTLGGVEPGYEQQVRGLLGIKEGAEKAARAVKDYGDASAHVQAYLKHLADEQERMNQILAHGGALMRQVQQEDLEAINARDVVLDSLEDGNALLRLENDTLGMTTEARELYILKLEEERDVKAALTPKDEERIRALYREREVLLGARKTLQEQAQAWNQLGDVAGAFFSDLVMNGKSAFDRLRDMLKQFLAEMLALFAKKWILQIGAGMTGSTALSAMAGSVGEGSLAGTVGSAALNWLGTGTGVVSSAFAGGNAFLQGMTGSFMGPMAPGSMASMGSQLGTFLMNPATIAVLAAVAIAVALRNRQGGPKEGGSYFGAYDAAGNFLGSRTVPGSDNGRFFTPSGGDSMMQQFGQSIAEGFFAQLRRLGGSTGGMDFGFGFDRDPRGSAASRIASLVRDASGNVVYSNLASAGRDDADFDRALGIEAKRAILAALQASDLPDAVAAILAPLDAMAATVEQIDAALAAAEAMAQIIDALAGLDISGLDIDALKAFQRDGEALGDTLSRVAGLWSQYQAAFLTDAEKLAMAQGAVTDTFSRLGVAVPDSMEAFKALVGGLDLSTEAGRIMWEALMEVAPAFAAVANAATDAAEASRQAAAAMLSTFESLMGQIRGPAYTRGRLQADLDSSLRQFQEGRGWAQGFSLQELLGQILTITDADMAQYVRNAGDGTDPRGAELINEILRLYAALNSGTETVGTLTTAIQDFDNSAQVALQRRGLEARILELQGDDFLALTRRRELELEAMDESLRPLQLLIWGLEDQARLAEEAARAAEELARAERALIDRRADLTEQLVELADGPEASLFMRRMRELAEETDPASRALMTAIWALEDADRAAKKLTDAMRETVAAMEQVAAFRTSLGASILSIRSAMAGFDAVGYHSGQVTSARAALSSATDLQGRLTAAGGLRDAIMARYQAEVDAINATHQAQSDAARAAIDAANELNRAFRNLGDYAKSMLTGELSTLSPDQKLAESGRQYQEILARARGGDVMALGQLQGAASNYLGQARGFYASSDAYVRIFGEVQGALAELGARAGPEQVFQENTAAWQSSLLDVQTRAIAELESLDAMTELWQRELQDTLDEQAIAFTELNLTSYQIEEHLRDLPQQIRDAINAATAALSQVIVSTGRAQSEENSDAIDGQNTVLMSIPFRVNGGVAVTERR